MKLFRLQGLHVTQRLHGSHRLRGGPELRRRGRARRRAVVATAVVAALAVVGIPAASADTAPGPGLPLTVSADVLPTVQVNGVVWAQVVVGKRVYATGSFTRARPAGSAAGKNETAQSNILAYDLETGALDTSFKASLNAQGLAVAASPDGTTIFVVGNFTTVNGVSRQRVVALDAVTGAVRTSFAPRLNGQARAVAVSGATVYVGGTFSTASGQARSRLAALSATDGAVLPWKVTADAEVWALNVPANKGKVVIGGRFTKLNGVSAVGMGAVNATTGAVMAWPANKVVRNYGAKAAITSLTSDGTTVYGTGYTYYGNGNFEGTFAASASTGALLWVNGCRGDHYDAVPIGPVLYAVSHAHDCAMVGGHPETKPRDYQHAMAWTTTTSADGPVNTYGTFKGRRASLLLHWLPSFVQGTYTGQNQATWSVEGTSEYVVIGGEFPSVNGVAQQGLVRFAVKSIAPNAEGARGGYTQLKPTLKVVTGGVKASWTAPWDRDNRRLKVELLRGEPVGSAVVVYQRLIDTNWWTRPAMTFTDKTAPRGNLTYRVRVTDPLGNVVSAKATVEH